MKDNSESTLVLVNVPLRFQGGGHVAWIRSDAHTRCGEGLLRFSVSLFYKEPCPNMHVLCAAMLLGFCPGLATVAARFQNWLVMSNVSHTNWSVCVFALLSSCFCCFSALEIQNIQRASFYDSVSGLHEPPGECMKPVGLPNRRVLSPQEELVGGWQGGREGRVGWGGGRVLGFCFCFAHRPAWTFHFMLTFIILQGKCLSA